MTLRPLTEILCVPSPTVNKGSDAISWRTQRALTLRDNCVLTVRYNTHIFLLIRDTVPTAQGYILSKYTACALIKYPSQITVLFWKALSESREGRYGRRCCGIGKYHHCQGAQKCHSKGLSHQKPTQCRKSQGTSSILFSTIRSAAFEPLSAIML